jgi:alpha-L-rhamnosidase
MRFSLVLAALVMAPASAAAAFCGAVKAVRLSVDGRLDSPLGLDNIHPTLSWQMLQTVHCNDDSEVCPGDEQSAYAVQAAANIDDLRAGRFIWNSGIVKGAEQSTRFDGQLSSRDTVAWRVRIWDALGHPSGWSPPSTWTVGLLNQSDWGDARWIEYPDRTERQPLPLFARQFDITKSVADARLYLSGVGMHHVTVNGEEVTDEVLAPGYSNYQLSSEYRTYDVRKLLLQGANALGVSLGNGPAYVRRSVTNPAVGRTGPYSWWQSQLTSNGTLAADVSSGSTQVRLSSVTGYFLGGTITINTGDGGVNLESRRITSISGSTISFTPGLNQAHSIGAKVTGSGNNIAASDPSAGAAVTPRLIGRLEITYTDGTSSIIVTNRDWRATLGPLTTDSWYAGSDYDARREQPGWDTGDADLTSSSWVSAGIAPPPNLATKLVARAAEPIKIQELFTPISVTNPANGIWVFDFGQNIVGWPQLNLHELPAGLVIRVSPAESLNANGTVEQSSLGPGSRGNDLFNTYTTSGRAASWHPDFSYFGMQWVQVAGLPAGFEPGPEFITGLRLQADVPIAGTFSSSDSRANRIHRMVRYSFAGNIMSVFTDCPGREKLSYPADYTMPMGAIYRNFRLDAFLRTHMRHLMEGQSVADTPMAGNVALKTPVYDWGYSGRFGDEINWGNAIVLVPSFLYDLYGDTTVMATYYEQMTAFVDYIRREKVQEGHIVDAALADWVDDDAVTSGRITGTWGYYLTISAMARMAKLTGHSADAESYATLAEDIKDAFNNAFHNEATGRYTNLGNASPSNASQAAQALALDAGLVPESRRAQVLEALVELTYSYPSADGNGPHLSGGTLGLGPIVRALSAGGRDDVLWESLQQNDRPSYGYFMEPTTANPDGFTTIGERWTRGSSKNHMILAQIDEWFHAGIAGIRTGPLTTLSSEWGDGLVFWPKLVGDLTSAEGTYLTSAGEARSEWTRDGEVFSLKVTVPANTRAEVRVPGEQVKASGRAKLEGREDGHAVYSVPSGVHNFNATISG